MSADFVYSVRMRASAGARHEHGGRHVSGAERLVEAEAIDDAAASLLRRARERAEDPDFVQVTIDRIPRTSVAAAPVLPVILATPATAAFAQIAASIRLSDAGVSEIAIERGFTLLREGISPLPSPQKGEAARGAMLIDASTGENITPDTRRGVRASRFDYLATDAKKIDKALADAGLGHFRTREALALATKVIWSGMLAELCWSDDAGYVAGYVATASGYVRFADFKPMGAVGGRAFFVDRSAIDMETAVHNLEKKALWITGPLRIEQD